MSDDRKLVLVPCIVCGEDVCVRGTREVKAVNGAEYFERFVAFWPEGADQESPAFALHNTPGFKSCVKPFIDALALLPRKRISIGTNSKEDRWAIDLDRKPEAAPAKDREQELLCELASARRNAQDSFAEVRSLRWAFERLVGALGERR